MIKHCKKCGKQMHREAQILICTSCLESEFKPPVVDCSFCSETNCVAWGNEYFKTINETIFIDFRADLEANQIDCQFGVLDNDGMAKESKWSNFAININYCPVCGRKLPEDGI